MTFCYKTQRTFAEKLELQDRVRGWKFLLEENFSVDQVLGAMKKFMQTSGIMPMPADIVAILRPASPRITEAQYVQACKAQERNGFPAFSYEDAIIREYRKQNEEDFVQQNREQIPDSRIAGIISKSVTRANDGNA